MRERTAGWYAELLRSYVRPTLGGRRLSDIKPLDIQALFSQLEEKPLSPKTIRHVHTTLSTAFEQAVGWRLMMLNPSKVVKPPRYVRKEMRTLTPEEAGRFLEAAKLDKVVCSVCPRFDYGDATRRISGSAMEGC